MLYKILKSQENYRVDLKGEKGTWLCMRPHPALCRLFTTNGNSIRLTTRQPETLKDLLQCTLSQTGREMRVTRREDWMQLHRALIHSSDSRISGQKGVWNVASCRSDGQNSKRWKKSICSQKSFCWLT